MKLGIALAIEMDKGRLYTAAEDAPRDDGKEVDAAGKHHGGGARGKLGSEREGDAGEDEDGGEDG